MLSSETDSSAGTTFFRSELDSSPLLSETSFSTLELLYLICLSLAQPVWQPPSPLYLTQTLAENKGKKLKRVTLSSLIAQPILAETAYHMHSIR